MPYKQLVVFIGICLSSSIANAQEFRPKSCSYFDLSKDIALEGCVMKESTVNGNFAYILTFKSGFKVTVEYVKSQGPNHIWRINGEKGMGYEINREHLHGVTLDLNEEIEWQDR